MENPQIIALVAIAISVIGIGLVIANIFVSHNTLADLKTNVAEQSQTIKSLNQQQIDTQQVIEEQRNSTMKMQDNIANLTSEIKSLEDRVASLEQRLQQRCLNPEVCPPIVPSKPVYFPGVVKFYNVEGGGGVTESRVVHQLVSALPTTGWIADFDYKFTVSNIPAFLVFDLTTTSDDPQSVMPPNRILIEHGNGVNQLFITSSGGFNSGGYDTAGIPISQNVQYYVKLERAPTQLTLNVFSDPARTIQVSGSPVSFAITPTDFSNLNFIQHDGCRDCGSARTLTAEIDNMKIFSVNPNGNKQPFFEDDYSSSVGWTQIGSSIGVNGSFIDQTPHFVEYNSVP